MLLRRLVGLVALVFGLVGVVACGAGAYGVWRVQSRLNRANDKVFDAVDRGLAAAQERVPVVRERVRQAKITTDEFHEAVRGWAAKKARDRVVEKLEIDARAEKLSGHLHAADLRLDASEMAVRDVRQLLELGQSLGANVDPAATDELLALLAQLQGTLGEAQQAVGEVRAFASPEHETPEERLIRIAKLLARILATFAEVDSRLDRVEARLSELRTEARQLKEKTSRYILLGAVACYVVLGWIAAGQAALIRWGWGCIRRKAVPEAPRSQLDSRPPRSRGDLGGRGTARG